MRKIFRNFNFLGYIEFIFCISSIVLMYITFMPPFRTLDSVSTWIKGYYYINYIDLGFIKRGFIGTLLKILNITNSNNPTIFVVIIHAILTTFLGLIFWRFAKLCFDQVKLKDKILFYSIFLLSPVMFIRFGYDIGRMDLWCFLISLITIFLISESSFSFLLISLIINLSISTQILIHEASLLIYIPFILVFYFYKFSDQIYLNFKKLLPIFSIPLFFMISLFLFGRYEPGQESLNLYLKDINQELIGSMPMELTYTLRDNVNFALNSLSFEDLIGGHFLIFSYYIFLLLISFNFVNLPSYFKVTCFTPILLSFLAIDTTRFFALSTICFNLLILIAARGGKLLFTQQNRLIIYTFIFTIFLLGPWGIQKDDALPLLKHFGNF